jgi:D-sedoheptulose 7-phosphate isomerase
VSQPDWTPLFRSRISDSIATTQLLLHDESLESASRIADRLLVALRSGGKVFFFGNGGSATEAQHLSAELLGRFHRDRPALPAVSLADNTAAMTAIGNDYSYEETFARQLLGLGSPGDVAIGMSTSGNSPNVVRALEAAKGHGLVTVAMTGAQGGRVAEIAHEIFRAPSRDTPRIQEAHLLIGHTICEIVENELFPASA